MNTYLSLKTKTATLASSKKEAAKKLGVKEGNITISAVHLDYVSDLFKKVN